MTTQEPHYATEFSATSWKVHLTAIGRDAVRGRPVTIHPVDLPNAQETAACEAFLKSIDGVLEASVSTERDALQHQSRAAADYYDAVLQCIGVLHYLGDVSGEELLHEMTKEAQCANDALSMFEQTQAMAVSMRSALRIIESTRLSGRAWPTKWQGFGLSHNNASSCAA